MPAVKVKDAQIKTASVEIRHVMVSNRKMTQSVFRQIPMDELVDFDADGRVVYRGTIWGQVNYWGGGPDKYYRDRDGNRKGRTHLLWQDGDELRRSVVAPDWDSCVPELPLGELSEYSTLWDGRIERLAMFRNSPSLIAKLRVAGGDQEEVESILNELEHKIGLVWVGSSFWWDNRHAALREFAALEKEFGSRSDDEIFDSSWKKARRFDELAEIWTATYEANLCVTPQLFIAV